jgi:hypothetical protein
MRRNIKLNAEKYGLYKRIMKHDLKAIEEIETLEEAKELIRMITGNPYLHSEVYQIETKDMIDKLKTYKDKSFNDISNV